MMLSKTLTDRHIKYGCVVSILVLVDDALEDRKNLTRCLTRSVSILVLVDDALEDRDSAGNAHTNYVSILVLVDDALEVI